MAKKLSNKNTVDFQKAKKKATAHKILKKLRIPIAVLLVIAIVSVSFVIAGKTRRSNIADSFKAIPATMGDSTGYPYSEDELSLEKLMLVGDKPMLISDTSIQVLSQNADLLQEIYTDWADTRAYSQNGRAFVYSNTSNKAILISRTDTLTSFSEGGTIVTGTVGKNGSVALSYTGDNAESIVKVYSPKQKTEFQWEVSRDYVSSLSLSPNGKNVLISALGVDNAEIYSRVVLFETNATEAKFDVKLEGTSILKVVYASFNKIIAIGDNKTVIFNSKGEQISEITYSEDSLFAVDNDSKGNTLLCYKIYGGSKINIVKIPAIGSIKQFEIDYTPISIDIKGSKIAIALDDKVTVYSPSGKEKDTYECSNNVSTVLLTSSGIYTLENGSVCKY